MRIEFRETYTIEQARTLEVALGAFARATNATERWLFSIKILDEDGGKETPFEGQTHGLRVVMGILSHARRALSHLTRGYDLLDASLTGWAGRSLVELRIWNRYVWASTGNMRRFHDDSLIDQSEMHKLVLDALKGSDSRPEAIAEVEHEIQELKAEFDVSIITLGERRLNVKVVCKEVGLEQFYKFWFGVLSKISHPTPALLIEVETGKEEISAQTLQSIFDVGMQSAIEILNTAVEGLKMGEATEQWTKLHEGTA